VSTEGYRKIRSYGARRVHGAGVAETRAQRLEYCELHTLAMVRLHDALRSLITQGVARGAEVRTVREQQESEGDRSASLRILFRLLTKNGQSVELAVRLRGRRRSKQERRWRNRRRGLPSTYINRVRQEAVARPAVITPVETNSRQLTPKHQGKAAIIRDQRTRPVNTIHNLPKSAKPPSPVQIRAAPPILSCCNHKTYDLRSSA
jgi:hypothetical protein